MQKSQKLQISILAHFSFLVHIALHLHVHVHQWMYVCVHVCVHVCMCPKACISISVHSLGFYKWKVAAVPFFSVSHILSEHGRVQLRMSWKKYLMFFDTSWLIIFIFLTNYSHKWKNRVIGTHFMAIFHFPPFFCVCVNFLNWHRCLWKAPISKRIDIERCGLHHWLDNFM